MKEHSLGIILGILNIVLLTVCGIFFMGKDQNAPEILLGEGSIVYAQEAGTDSLFEGVTAFDEEDGELTDSVVIEKIVTNEAKETATITYGVADSSGNVGKVTCTVDMIVEDGSEIAEEANTLEAGIEKKETSVDKTEEDADSESEEENTETEEDADSESEEENAEADEDVNSENEEDAEADEDVNTESEEDAEADEESPEETEAEEDSDEVNEEEEIADSQEEEITEEPAEEDKQEALPTAGEAGNAGQNSEQNSGRPSIVFKAQEIKAKAGSGPAWVNVIGSLDDDKDNYETLFRTLKVNGTYDKNTAGIYDVTVTVTDSDGNESDSYPMRIIVEE